MIWRKLKSSRTLALVAIFAAFNVITDSFGGLPTSGVWFSWSFMMTPLTGIILGPFFAFSAASVGVMIGHYLYFIDVFEFLFTFGAPVGAMVSALLYRGKWQAVLVLYLSLFAAYFATPVAWQLPIWGLWDTYVALAVLLVAIFLIRRGYWKHEPKRLTIILLAAAFVGLEADILFRVFLLIPLQTYRFFYGLDPASLQAVWFAGAALTPLKAIMSSLATLLVGLPLVKTLKKAGFLID